MKPLAITAGLLAFACTMSQLSAQVSASSGCSGTASHSQGTSGSSGLGSPGTSGTSGSASHSPGTSGSSGSGSTGTSGSSSSSGHGCLCLSNASVHTTGVGCAPAGLTIPTLTEVGMPVPGNPVGVDVQSPSTPNSFGILLFGLSTTFDPVLNVPLPFDLAPVGFPGCALYTNSVWPVAVGTDANGDGNYSTPIPALAKWCDRELTFQVFFLSSNSELLTSAGLTQVFGN
ncbi:MAG: hypothetical protein KDC98_18860 [Planctomycetes bacterium]|nr:hypothetical protein [Planctomycetota bacterium]